MEAFRREIFEHLANVFYAIAAEQRTPLIMAGEIKMAIRKDWLGAADGDGTYKVSEAAHLIGVAIDALQSEQMPASDAFAAFEGFYRKHEEQFSHALKKQILETADTVMRILPSVQKRNECYERLKKLLYVPMDVNVKLTS
jgi:hypothetical protein